MAIQVLTELHKLPFGIFCVYIKKTMKFQYFLQICLIIRGYCSQTNMESGGKACNLVNWMKFFFFFFLLYQVIH